MLLHELLIRSTVESPTANAIIGKEGRYRYQALNTIINLMIAELLAAGAARGDRVGIYLPKSMLAVAATQAILRIGAIYVPIDALAPVQRALAILCNCSADFVIISDIGRRSYFERNIEHNIKHHSDGAENHDHNANRQWSGVCLCWQSETWSQNTRHGEVRPPLQVDISEDDTAFILHTSGSTGTPKGVCISHRNAIAFVQWCIDELNINRQDILANHAGLHFDLSILDIYASFAVGASVAIIADADCANPTALAAFMESIKPTIWYSVPSVWMLMMQYRVLPLNSHHQPRLIIYAGEPFAIEPLRKLAGIFPQSQLYNFYGPTETNVCLFHKIDTQTLPYADAIPIGKPSCDNHVWLDTDGAPSELSAPAGRLVGELVVQGPTVMQGYWPLNVRQQIYKTGDLAWRDPSGNFFYVGRRDGMVKVAGRRIELGDIEHCLRRHREISDVGVTTTGENIDTKIVAFIVHGTARATNAISLLAIKRHCSEHLPSYMCVDKVQYVEQLPRNRNGKLDRLKLKTLAM